MCSLVSSSGVLQEIDKMMSRCFWSNNDRHLKHHWIAWKTICKTKEEGGLGIRSIYDIIKVQALKLCWKIKTEQSLWTEFMKKKYSKEIEDGNHVGRPLINWRRIWGVWEEANTYITEGNDGNTWNLAKDGKFSTKVTWKHTRHAEEEPLQFRYIWNKFTPNRISIFMWKLMQHKLPIDDSIKRIGASMASRCKCCNNYKNENHMHFFYDGEVATAVWSFFHGVIGIRSRHHNFAALLKNW